MKRLCSYCITRNNLTRLTEAMHSEVEAIVFYEQLSRMTQDRENKDILAHILEDEHKHLRDLECIYQEITGCRLTLPQPVTPYITSFCEGLMTAFFDELSAYEFYRNIYLANQNFRRRNVFFLNMSDENEHAIKLNYLISKMSCRPVSHYNEDALHRGNQTDQKRPPLPVTKQTEAKAVAASSSQTPPAASKPQAAITKAASPKQNLNTAASPQAAVPAAAPSPSQQPPAPKDPPAKAAPPEPEPKSDKTKFELEVELGAELEVEVDRENGLSFDANFDVEAEVELESEQASQTVPKPPVTPAPQKKEAPVSPRQSSASAQQPTPNRIDYLWEFAKKK